MRARARPAARMSIIGRVKAAVLPVPVWAQPSTSRPISDDGDGLLLDRGGSGIAGVYDRLKKFRRESKFAKIH